MGQFDPPDVDAPGVERVSGRETPGTREMRELAAAHRRSNPFATQDGEAPSMDFRIPGRGLAGEGGLAEGQPGQVRGFQENLLPTTMGLIGPEGGGPMTKYGAKMAGQEMITQDWLNRQGMYGYHAGQLAAPNTYAPMGQEALAGLAGLLDPAELARRRQAQMGGIASAQQGAVNTARAQHRMRTGQGLDPVQAAQMQQANALQAAQQMAKWDAEERTQAAQIGTSLASEAGKWGTLEQEGRLGAANWGIGAWQGPLDLSLLSTPSTTEEQYGAYAGSPYRARHRLWDTPEEYWKFGYGGFNPTTGRGGRQPENLVGANQAIANEYNNPFMR